MAKRRRDESPERQALREMAIHKNVMCNRCWTMLSLTKLNDIIGILKSK